MTQSVRTLHPSALTYLPNFAARYSRNNTLASIRQEEKAVILDAIQHTHVIAGNATTPLFINYNVSPQPKFAHKLHMFVTSSKAVAVCGKLSKPFTHGSYKKCGLGYCATSLFNGSPIEYKLVGRLTLRDPQNVTDRIYWDQLAREVGFLTRLADATHVNRLLHQARYIGKHGKQKWVFYVDLANYDWHGFVQSKLLGNPRKTIQSEFTRVKNETGQHGLKNYLIPGFKQMAEGLHEVHQRGILHLDLKPDNFLVSLVNDISLPVINGVPLFSISLTDFGLSSFVNAPQVQMREGAYGFLAPERVSMFAHKILRSQNSESQPAEWSSHITVKSDVWGLGITFYEMFYGRNKHPAWCQMVKVYCLCLSLIEDCLVLLPRTAQQHSEKQLPPISAAPGPLSLLFPRIGDIDAYSERLCAINPFLLSTLKPTRTKAIAQIENDLKRFENVLKTLAAKLSVQNVQTIYDHCMVWNGTFNLKINELWLNLKKDTRYRDPFTKMLKKMLHPDSLKRSSLNEVFQMLDQIKQDTQQALTAKSREEAAVVSTSTGTNTSVSTLELTVEESSTLDASFDRPVQGFLLESPIYPAVQPVSPFPFAEDAEKNDYRGASECFTFWFRFTLFLWR